MPIEADFQGKCAVASVVMLRHKDSGIVRRGYYGFSWTTFFFGFFPALFRGDFITFISAFVVIAILLVTTYGIGASIAMFVWAFFYNRYYTRRLLERGYTFADSEGTVAEAKMRLGVS
jgi:hypothetical protein